MRHKLRYTVDMRTRSSQRALRTAMLRRRPALRVRVNMEYSLRRTAARMHRTRCTVSIRVWHLAIGRPTGVQSTAKRSSGLMFREQSGKETSVKLRRMTIVDGNFARCQHLDQLSDETEYLV